MAVSAGEGGYGTTFAIGDGATPTEAFTKVGEVKRITPPSKSRNAVEATHLESDDAYREFKAGIKDGGEVSIELNFIPSTSHVLDAAFEAGQGNFRIVWTLSDESTVTCTFNAVMTDWSPGDATFEDEAMLGTATFKVSGKPVYS